MMKKILYLSAALLAFSSTELMAARQATTGNVIDNLKCTADLPTHALESYKKGKKDGTTVNEFKRCIKNVESAPKADENRYKNFVKIAEKTLKDNPEFAKHIEGK